MPRRISVSCVVFGSVIVAAWLLPVPRAFVLAQPGGGKAGLITFDDKSALTAWSVTGEAAIDRTRGRGGKGGALKVGPGGKAVLTLRDKDESGRIDLWVYDDGAAPENAKAHRVGPRWGLVQGDGRVLAVGILYANYLGGDEGYTASACDGKSWYDQLFWLGVRRKPAGWHKWTFNFRTKGGLQVLHNDRDVSPRKPPRVDPAKVGLKGFRAIAVWGDDKKGAGQTIWVDDVSVALGGPVKSIPQPRPAAPRVEGPNPWVPVRQTATIYTEDAPPTTPEVDDLPLKTGVSQHGITWTFAEPARVGQFINGDWYVIGKATVVAVAPKPLYGRDIPEIELDRMDLERKVAHRVRNGFMLNPPAKMKVAYDSGVRNWFDPSLIRKLPVAMKPGDSLVSTISMPKGLVLAAPLRNKIERGVGDGSPIRTAAVLTCVARPQPPDAFRPGFCDRKQRIYLSRSLKRALLPEVARPKNMLPVGLCVRFTQRPWVGTCFFGFEEPVENMPQYGMEYGRVSGVCALELCTDLTAEQKEPLLINYVQVGIDLGGIVRGGHPGWSGWGGHGSGRKLPIVFAGLLLGDEELANVSRSFPKVSFGEDEQTAYGDCWTGAKVVFAGHSGIDTASGAGRSRNNSWGPYEHLHPSKWNGGNNTSEAYRRTCTGAGWVAQALALRLLGAEKAWGHDAFFDYVDRWMHEDDTEHIKTIKQATGKDYNKEWARHGWAWQEKEAFVKEMWAKHRTGPGMPPTDGWQGKHDDSRYRAAVEKMK